MRTIETKPIYWFYNGKRFEGTAEFVVEDGERCINLRIGTDGDCFDYLSEDMCTHGVSIEDVWEIIPKDVTDFELC